MSSDTEKSSWCCLSAEYVMGQAYSIRCPAGSGLTLRLLKISRLPVGSVQQACDAGKCVRGMLPDNIQYQERRADISFDSEDKSLCSIFRKENDELGISIIEALMDNFELSADGSYILSMSKTIEGKRDNAY